MYTIYTLRDPLTDTIYYVGATRQTLEQRQMGHFSEHSHPTSEKLNKLGIKPIIEEVDSIDTSCKRYAEPLEEYWILQFCAWGFPLENKVIAFGKKWHDKKNTMQMSSSRC